MKTAMILSAGRGERLKPITDSIPKPLCVLAGKPLIVHHLENLAKARFERVVINHAWLGGKIRRCLGNGNTWGVNIEYAPEPPGGLETAGGIVNALSLLGTEPFVCINGDIYTDFDLSQLQIPDESLIHLLLVNKDPSLNHHGDFGLKYSQVSNTDRLYTYPGIACYKPALFENALPGRYSLTPLLRAQVESGNVSGQIYEGIWFDIGSLQRYAYAMEKV